MNFRFYFLKLLSSFFLLTIVPIIVLGIVLYTTVYVQSKNDFLSQQDNLLNDISLNIQSQIGEVESELATKKLDPTYANFNSFSYKPMELYNLSKDLKLMTSKKTIIDSVYFLDLFTKRIYSTASGMYDFDKFYDTYWFTDLKNTAELQRLPVRLNMNEEFYHENINAMSIYRQAQVLTILATNFPKNVIAVNIDLIKLYQYIDNTYSLNEAGDFYLISKSNEILYGPNGIGMGETYEIDILENFKGRSEPLFSNNKVYFSTPIYYDELYCAVSYPTSVFNQLPEYFGFYIFIICLIIIFLLSILTYVISKRLYSPINTLYREISNYSHIINSDSELSEDEIQVFKNVFREMNTYYQSSKQELETYKEMIKSSELRLYLNGMVEFEKFYKQYEDFVYEHKDDLYLLLIINIQICDNQDEYKKYRTLLHEIVDLHIKTLGDGLFFEIECSKYVLITTGQTKEALTNTITIMSNALDEFSVDTYYISTSEAFKDFKHVLEVYQETDSQMEKAIYFDEKNKVTNSNMFKATCESDFDIIVNYEKDLIREVVSHNKRGCLDILGDLQKFLLGTANVPYIESVCQRIFLTIEKEFNLSKKFGIDILDMVGERTLDSRIKTIEEICFYAIEKYDCNDVVENQYCIEAKEYIDENFEQDIEIAAVAENMNISYSYLSKIFKENMDMRLSEYLNLKRIEKGKEYLTMTNLTINEIAEKIGYNNSQSFQRYFKKYENITPGNYRKHFK